MTWYTGCYGSWRKGDCVIRLDGTYNRKQMFEKAQSAANEVGREVTVIAETGSVQGLRMKTYKFKPETTREG